MIIEFPRLLLRENSHDWNIVGNTATAGQTAASSVDIRSDGGGLWSASLNDIQFRDEADTLLWRAVRQACNGGVSPIIVPRNDTAFCPFPVGAFPPHPVITHSDTSLFGDTSGYYQSIIDVTCSGGAALRATQMTMNLNFCGALGGGEAFSIRHPTLNWRMYEIYSVIDVDDTHAIVKFNPPLREAIGDGEPLEFDRPRCTMKLVNAASMDLNVTTSPFSRPTAKFIESKYA